MSTKRFYLEKNHRVGLRLTESQPHYMVNGITQVVPFQSQSHCKVSPVAKSVPLQSQSHCKVSPVAKGGGCDK